MSSPPPCQRCGRARLSTGLCPHCEHVFCLLCSKFMSIIEYADHVWCHRFSYQYQERKSRLLFWWEIKRDWPVRCPDCDSILNNDGTCPDAIAARERGDPPRASHPGLLDPAQQPPPRRF